MNDTANSIEEIAIIGMAGRFPGARNITEFWQNLVDGVESISRFSDEELLSRGVPEDKIKDPDYVKAGTILQDADMFDAAFFGYNQRDAEMMDPQQRVFLEVAWEALESAGCDPDSYDGSIAVFAGTSGNDYRKHIAANQLSITSGLDSFEVMVGNDADFLTTRVSYKLNLKGPSLTIQTACSTSLVAVHQACQSLLTYQCDMALAGGICIRFPQGQGYIYQEGMIWSPDGHCRPFDAQAQGTLFGHGVGIVVMKRLSEALQDGDMILAVIKGSAINNDGAMKVGFTAPSVDGQAEVISTALGLGDVAADTVGYIETHGTGTPLGDPIEIEALTQSFRDHTAKTGYCAIGSVKSNIGHLDTAAGIAGLIKTVLALHHKKIPPSLHFTSPNPNIDFAKSPFYVNNTLQEWQSDEHPRRAGVSSFGVGGTNAHVVLEEAPATNNVKSSRSWHLLPLSAKSESALQALTANLAVYLDNNPHLLLEDTAHTLQQGRKHFSQRRIAVCSSLEDAAQVLSLNEPERIITSVSPVFTRNVIFMFSGQGSQHVNMCRDLYQEYPFFKNQVDLCSQILQPHLGLDLRDILYPPGNNIKEATQHITQTSITQPALFTIEYSLAKLLNHLGIFPSALVGHSIGEYTAACIAGVFSLEDALKLVAARGRLMQSLPPGSMLAIPLSKDEVQPYLSPDISLAVLNSASMSVVSGETHSIDGLANLLLEKGIEGRILHTSHAFHSPMMEPILEDFEKEVAKTKRNTPQLPFVSNLTGTWITANQAQDPSFWAKHLRQTVQYFACAGELLTTYPKGILMEVGPGQTLSLLTKQHPSSTKEHCIMASARRPVERKNDVQYFLNTLGQLWLNGCQIEWSKLYEDEKRRRIPLPTYPFERKRYWIEDVPHVSLNRSEEKVLKSCQQIDSNDNLRYLNRQEKQVELKDSRIELDKIESALNKHEALSQSAVFVKEVQPGDTQLFAYFVVSPNQDVTVTELRKHLEGRIPEHMIPQHFEEVEKLIMTPGGEIDREGLVAFLKQGEPLDEKSIPSLTASENFLAEIWKETLEVERVSAHDNFFAIGGHSLLAMQVIERIRKETGIRLRLQTIVLNTLKQIAAEYPFVFSEDEGTEKVATQGNKPAGSTAESFQRLKISSRESQDDYSKKKSRMLEIPIISQERRLQPFFFGSSQSPLFGIYHPPDSRYMNDKGVLLCYPIGHEYMRIHFTFRRLAQMLSDMGCHVFRFDYFGIGDSAGESREGDVDRWKADICSAFQELKDISGVRNISMVGVRFGATLAALSSVNGLSVNELVLWDPVVVGREYVEEFRAINNNLGHFFNTIGENDNFEELLGYPFPASLRKGIEQINLLSKPQYSSGRIILITSENRKEYWDLRNQFEANGTYFEHHTVSDAHEWGKPENFTKTVLVNETLQKIRAVIAEDLK